MWTYVEQLISVLMAGCLEKDLGVMRTFDCELFLNLHICQFREQ